MANKIQITDTVLVRRIFAANSIIRPCLICYFCLLLLLWSAEAISASINLLVTKCMVMTYVCVAFTEVIGKTSNHIKIFVLRNGIWWSWDIGYYIDSNNRDGIMLLCSCLLEIACLSKNMIWLINFIFTRKFYNCSGIERQGHKRA